MEEATSDRVSILDCIDFTNYVIAADTSGDILTDLENQAPRFHFYAEVAQDVKRVMARGT